MDCFYENNIKEVLKFLNLKIEFRYFLFKILSKKDLVSNKVQKIMTVIIEIKRLKVTFLLLYMNGKTIVRQTAVQVRKRYEFQSYFCDYIVYWNFKGILLVIPQKITNLREHEDETFRSNMVKIYNLLTEFAK